MVVVADRLRLRWNLDYDLTESLPDHCSLTRIRERYGLDVFRRFCQAIVEQCLHMGLVWGRARSIDATNVVANAATDSLQPRFAVEAHLARLFVTEGDPGGDDGGSGHADDAGGDAPAPLPGTLTETAPADLAERAAQRHDGIRRAGRPNRHATRGYL